MVTAFGPVRVLVVDDCRDTTDSLAILLRLWGYEPITANDGAAALDLARTYQPAVALLDVKLPDMDGYAVARRIRAEERAERAFLIALTGLGQETDRQQSQEAGFDHHLVKPTDPAELQALLARVVGLSLQAS